MAYGAITENMSDADIIARYRKLEADAKVNGYATCFTCGQMCARVSALVAGPNDNDVPNLPLIVGRGHGVCRPCIRRGEASVPR